MSTLFYFVGFLTALIGGATSAVAWASSMGWFWTATGLGITFSSLSFFAISGVLSRLDDLIALQQADQDRRRIEPR